ncbi:transcription termination/antitermination protein NusA [Candidatus Parcubacteria bacterium]|nr:MAG: transcription termination/antitermination protein NusA [Candidatus Parcubacteria bacterium]
MDLKQFGQAVRELAHDKGIPETKVIETIELAVAAAYKKDYGKRGQIIRAKFDPESGGLSFTQVKLVVDESMIKSEEEVEAEERERMETSAPASEGERPSRQARRADADEGEEELVRPGAEGEAAPRKVRFNPERHIMLAEARAIRKDAESGMELSFPLDARHEFGRIASQTAKQVIIQRVREAEREATYSEYKVREGEIISGVVQRIEGRTIFLNLGRGAGVLPAEEQIARERYALGDRLKALLIVVEKDMRGPGLVLSRSHPRFLRKLFELEVPEIANGVVEIRAIAREAGSRSKVAVASTDPAVDPVGSMVGQRGVRVSTVTNELAGEKIDIIEWSDDSGRFIQNALSPAKILNVALDADRREAIVTAPEDQLSLAIGKGGQNVRLAAKLTGWKIDVRPPAGEASPAGESAPPTDAVANADAAGPPPSDAAEALQTPAEDPAKPPQLGESQEAMEKQVAAEEPAESAEQPADPESDKTA